MVILHCTWLSLDIVKRKIDKAAQFVIFSYTNDHLPVADSHGVLNF